MPTFRAFHFRRVKKPLGHCKVPPTQEGKILLSLSWLLIKINVFTAVCNSLIYFLSCAWPPAWKETSLLTTFFFNSFVCLIYRCVNIIEEKNELGLRQWIPGGIRGLQAGHDAGKNQFDLHLSALFLHLSRPNFIQLPTFLAFETLGPRAQNQLFDTTLKAHEWMKALFWEAFYLPRWFC